MNAIPQFQQTIAQPPAIWKPKGFDAADWLARFEAEGHEVHLNHHDIACVRNPENGSLKRVCAFLFETGRPGLPCGHEETLSDYLRSIGRRPQAIIRLDRDYPDVHEVWPDACGLRKGDWLTIGSLPGLRGDGLYVVTCNNGQTFYVVGWVKALTTRGNLRRRISTPICRCEPDSDWLFRVVGIGRDL